MPLLFIENNPDGRRKIQTANEWTGWQSQRPLVVGVENRLGKSRGFTSKNERVPSLELHIPDCSPGKSRKEEESLIAKLIEKILPIDGVTQLEVLPVVEPSASQLGIVDAKGGWTDDPQFCPRGDAGSADVAGVLWNLGLVQNDIGRRTFRVGGFGPPRIWVRDL